MLISVLEMGRLTCKGYCDVICTTIHPVVWRYTYQCGGAADGGRRLRSQRRNRALKVVYFNVLTIKLFKWTAPLKSNYASIIIINIWAYFQNVSLKVCCKHYEIRCSFHHAVASPLAAPHIMYTYRHTPGWMGVHMTSHNHLKRKWRAEQCVLIHIFFAIDTSGHGVSSCECRRREPYVKAKFQYRQNCWTNLVSFGLLQVTLRISEIVLELKGILMLSLHSDQNIRGPRVIYSRRCALLPTSGSQTDE